MNYYGCGAVDKDTNFTDSKTKSKLIEMIKQAFEVLTCDAVKEACARFLSHISAVFDTEGTFFE